MGRQTKTTAKMKQKEPKEKLTKSELLTLKETKMQAAMETLRTNKFCAEDWEKLGACAEMGKRLEEEGAAHGLGILVLVHMAQKIPDLMEREARTMKSKNLSRDVRDQAFKRHDQLFDRGIKLGNILSGMKDPKKELADTPKNFHRNPSFKDREKVNPLYIENLQVNMGASTVKPEFNERPINGNSMGT